MGHGERGQRQRLDPVGHVEVAGGELRAAGGVEPLEDVDVDARGEHLALGAQISARGRSASSASTASTTPASTASSNRFSGGASRTSSATSPSRSRRTGGMPPSWRAVEDLVEHVVALPGRELALLAPRDRDALLSEEAFEHEEFLPYWAELWPSALALARVVARRAADRPRACSSSAAGSGCRRSPPRSAGGRVLATDWSPDVGRDDRAQRRAQRRCALDAARVPLGRATRRRSAPPWPLVLASDVLYEAPQRRAAARAAAAPDRRRRRGLARRPGPDDHGGLPGSGRRRLWRIDAIPHDGPVARASSDRLRPRAAP